MSPSKHVNHYTVSIAALVLAAAAGAQPARANAIVNGSFENSSIAGSYQVGSASNPSGTVLNGWNNLGYTFVFTPGTASSGGATASEHGGTFALSGPGSGVANGLPATSPDGGNFIAMDVGYEPGPISQTVNGLVAGQTYALTFDWAGAEAQGYAAPTTESWDISFGNDTFSTTPVTIGSQGFSSWLQVTQDFTAQSSSQVLSFLAAGTPSGAPPVALLDGVSLTAVPEPATWALLTLGLVVSGFVWRRRRS